MDGHRKTGFRDGSSIRFQIPTSGTHNIWTADPNPSDEMNTPAYE